MSIHCLYGQSSNSVLSTGTWYKIAVLEDGVYRVDASLLDKAGIDRKKVDVSKIAIYGNAFNGMLPQPNEADRPDDLIENAIMAVGLEDGVFDKSDYLLFYGRSADHLSFESASGDFLYEKNLYSDTAFYFLTVKEEPAIRMSSQQVGEITGVAQSTYTRFSAHEIDRTNLINSGRYWYGESFLSSSKSLILNFDAGGLVDGSAIKVYASAAVYKATVNSSFDFSINGDSVGSLSMLPYSGDKYDEQAVIDASVFQSTLSDATRLELKIDFVIGSNSGTGYLDYAHVMSVHDLNLAHRALSFYGTTAEVLQIKASDNTAQVWDVTDPTQVMVQQVQLSGDVLKFQSQRDAQHFYAFEESQIKKPIAKAKIANQNLHGMAAAEVIYITHRLFLQEAQRLADFRTTHDGLTTAVVTVDQIYNEYASGRQDITAIRDFIKMQYDTYGTLRYVTLVGDCSYDYKDRTFIKTNYVPVYEARNSIDPIESYSSEDYYGFLEDDEGEWVESAGGDHTLEIGVGRIPVRNVSDLSEYVSKVIRYESSQLTYGNWRNKVVFIADDGDANIHQRDADRLTTFLDTTNSELNVRKVFIDSYPQIGVPGSIDQRSPQAKAAFAEAISNGSLIVNYTGHGNEDKLSDESILDVDMIQELSNRHLMPFFVTATCQFGNYDNPSKVSGGEQILGHAQGGAIAMLTSTRAVVSNTNYTMNRAFYESLVVKEDGRYRRLGDLMRDTKNNSLAGPRNRNYALLGDASMRLAFAGAAVELTHINGQPLDQLDSLGALGSYQLAGQVMSGGVLDASFDGTVVVTIFDKPTQFKTLGDQSSASIYDERDVVLFQGEASVRAGVFSIETIIPKNINYSFGKGKISFYAMNTNKTWDAHGAFDEVVIGGSVKGVKDDTDPPSMELYMGDVNFVNGSKVASNTVFMAKLTDESGINTSKLGFGNDLVMYLDDSTGIKMNNYYTAALDTYQEGWVIYPMYNLAKGEHRLKMVAFDTYNNPVERSIEFYVSDKNEIKISDLMNYPNPFLDQTTFKFSQDRLGEELDISISITNLQGQTILKTDYYLDDAPLVVSDITWDGQDANGNKVKKGIYIYQIFIQSRVDGAKAQAYQKLLVLE
ncbi:type IX secretion system sortase PorU [Reichenbachiella agarivorans]|uniref:Type IX secretion system sortase PorU n=1 Tax=Reichenbachiella agarivorans TaxID=2979464 RepID=A0ABY6CTC9_9BACT|nr:type IX secretion system sortase PorU [Reichenbachiella agarivorans]UXP33250.1 type IX secretion system sortase PorU [Reichenbachiella agarivorans]